jgi:RecB family endonuclease NucS
VLAAVSAVAAIAALRTPFAYLLGGVALISATLARSENSLARRYRLGADAEGAVARDLRILERRGYGVTHDVAKGGRGNVDHVVVAPWGETFAIETKRSRWDRSTLTQVARHADWLRRRGHRSVTPVICVQRSSDRPYQYAGVWIVGSTHLVALLRGLGG